MVGRSIGRSRRPDCRAWVPVGRRMGEGVILPGEAADEVLQSGHERPLLMDLT